MFKFLKKIFTAPVTESDVLVLEIYGTVLSSLGKLKEQATTDETKKSIDEKIEEARTKFVDKLSDMVKRGYVHDQLKA